MSTENENLSPQAQALVDKANQQVIDLCKKAWRDGYAKGFEAGVLAATAPKPLIHG